MKELLLVGFLLLFTCAYAQNATTCSWCYTFENCIIGLHQANPFYTPDVVLDWCTISTCSLCGDSVYDQCFSLWTQWGTKFVNAGWCGTDSVTVCNDNDLCALSNISASCNSTLPIITVGAGVNINITNNSSDPIINVVDSPTFAGNVVVLGTTTTHNILPASDTAYDIGANGTSYRDIYIGRRAIVSDSAANTFIGAQAGSALGALATQNVAIGYQALQGLSGTSDNVSFAVAIGYQAGQQASNGGTITAPVYIGFQAGQWATTSGSNVAVGAGALQGIQGAHTVTTSVAVGFGAGQFLTSSVRSTLVGFQAGKFVNGSCNDLVYLGQFAGANNLGTQSIAVGSGALSGVYGQTTASRVVAIGHGAAGGSTVTTPVDAVFIGYTAGQNAVAPSNVVFIGRNAGINAQGSNNVGVGSNALAGASGANSASNSVAIGGSAGASVTSSTRAIFIGFQAGQQATSASDVVYIGQAAGFNANATGLNVGIGTGALQGVSAHTVTQTIAIGHSAGNIATSNSRSVFIGYQSASQANGSFADVVYNGYRAGQSATGSSNVGVGSGALQGTLGTNTAATTTAVGFNAGTAVTNSTLNCFYGSSAGSTVQSGSKNVIVGASSTGRSDLDQSILIGYNNAVSTTVSGSIALGVGITVSASNTLYLGSAGTTLTTGTSSPSAGAAGALPATPAGYLTVVINGVSRQIPYY